MSALRKIVLFVLLFGAGLAAVLWWRGATPRDPRPTPAQPPSATTPGQFTEVPARDPSVDEGAKRVGVELDGKLKLTQFAGEGAARRPRLVLESSEVDALGGDAYDMHDLDVKLHDVETDAVEVHLRSPRSRVAVTIVDGKPQLGAGDVVHLSAVTVELFTGAPVVPLELQVPLLAWEIEARRMRSDDPVTIRGQGLDARGTGLRAELGAERFELVKDGVLNLDLAGRGTATLSATGTGPLAVSRRIEGEVERVDVVASRGARLVVSTDEPFTLDADEIRLEGRASQGEQKSFALESAEARGSVVAQSRGDRFRAQRARFAFAAGDRLSHASLTDDVALERGDDVFHADAAEFAFDAARELERATLSGSPRGSIAIEGRAPVGRPELARARADISGTGPLVVRRENGTAVSLAGPGRVEIAGESLALEARERLEGHVAEDRRSGSLHARGGAVLTQAGRTLRSEALDLGWQMGADDVAIFDASSNAATTIDGPTQAGDRFTLEARGGLEARVEGERLIVTNARDVTLEVEGQEPFQAQATSVRDLDWEKRTLEAEGDVVVKLQGGRAIAERALVHGENDVELFGVSHRPARFLMGSDEGAADGGIDAAVSALWIRAHERSFEARGDVRVHVETDGDTLDVEGAKVDLVFVPEGLPGREEPHTFTLVADERAKARAVRASETIDLEAQRIEARGRAVPRSRSRAKGELVVHGVEAQNDVVLGYRGQGELSATGDLLAIDDRRHGRIAAGAGGRVTARGRFPSASLPYELTADEIEFDPEKIEAANVDVRLDRKPAPARVESDVLVTSKLMLEALRAERVRATKQRIVLEGKARIEGSMSQREAWSLDAGAITIEGDFQNVDRVRVEDVRSLVAEHGFSARLGERVRAQGETLRGNHETIEVIGSPARIEFMDAQWESNRFLYRMEQMLLATDKGRIDSGPSFQGESWSLSYESLQPFDQADGSILLALRNPRFRLGAQQLFADWALFWVDPDEWRATGSSLLERSVEGEKLKVGVPEEGRLPPHPKQKERQAPRDKWDFLAALQANPLFEFLSEAYLEGNLELFDAGQRFGRAGALYLDVVEGHGWLSEADVQVDIDVRGLPSRLRATAEWMRISPGPTLRADKAVITSCDYAAPHYVIETGDLRIEKHQNTEDERVAWSVRAQDNAIRFESGFALPLPPLVFETNEEGDPLIDRFVLGDSAKYGTQIRASINTGLGTIGVGVGKVFSTLLDFPEIDIRGRWRYDAGYLGSRGVMLGIGLDLRAADKFKLETTLSAIPDRRDDKGLVRVDRDDRDLLRAWFRSRGRYTIDPYQWVDLALTRQSDPGVQSEFFEREFLRYEQKDNYLHWRRARDDWYMNASVKALLEDRTDVEELPTAGLYRGRAPIGKLGELPLLYSGYVDGGWLRRREGEPPYYEPFPDGLGERDVARVDTQHRLETPFALGFLGARATPFVSARATGWSEGADPDARPGRAALLAGVETATTIWKRTPRGTVHTLTPSLGFRQDFASEETGGELVPIDEVERPIEGRFVEAGLRSRWWKLESKDRLDVDLRLAHGSSLPDDEPEGLQPLQTLSEYYTFVGDVPVGLTHDGRYDLRDTETVYSRTFLGFEPMPAFGIEFGHHRGQDRFGEGLYEAASGTARYRWTTKWELEFHQTYSLSSGRGLDNELTVRRLGHDFVLEIEFGYRAGEGTTFGISVLPKLSWKRSGLGIIDRWLGLYH